MEVITEPTHSVKTEPIKLGNQIESYFQARLESITDIHMYVNTHQLIMRAPVTLNVPLTKDWNESL